MPGVPMRLYRTSGEHPCRGFFVEFGAAADDVISRLSHLCMVFHEVWMHNYVAIDEYHVIAFAQA